MGSTAGHGSLSTDDLLSRRQEYIRGIGKGISEGDFMGSGVVVFTPVKVRPSMIAAKSISG